MFVYITLNVHVYTSLIHDIIYAMKSSRFTVSYSAVFNITPQSMILK